MSDTLAGYSIGPGTISIPRQDTADIYRGLSDIQRREGWRSGQMEVPIQLNGDVTIKKVSNGFLVSRQGNEYVYRNMVELTEYLTQQFGE